MEQGSRTRSRGVALAAIAVMLLATGSVGFADAETPATDATVTVPLAPTRILDTRSGLGAPAAPLGPGESLDLQVTGAAGVPVGAVGVLLNVTADGATEQTYLTIWPSGQERPEASSLNPAPGQPVPNFIEAKLGADGKLSIYNFTGTVNVIADVAGYQVPVGSVTGLPGGGTPGPVGPQGPAGPPGLAAWDVIPAGQTVRGSAEWRTPTMQPGDMNTETISLPGVPPVALAAATIGFMPDNAAQVLPADIDPQCTSIANGYPVAPPGQLCVRLGFSLAAAEIRSSATPRGDGFTVGWTTGGAVSPTRLEITWAYTAPT